MTRPVWRSAALLLLAAASAPESAPAPRSPAGTLVIAAPREPATPIPTLFHNDNANREISDLLFLRLAQLPPSLTTTEERSFVPQLARRWTRRDPVTLVFELDPRARWQDGTPVTARDVTFTFGRARESSLDPQLGVLLRRIREVTAEGDHRVVFRFTEAYPEQLYDAVYHVPLLPAHLLDRVPPESLATTPFTADPVGDGPYRWVRRVPGQLIELAADSTFFLGRPGIGRVVFLFATDAEARVNLILSGEADAIDNVYAYPNPNRLLSAPGFRQVTVPSLGLGYLTFNQRDPSDTARPHPVLADSAVREALVLGLDRARIAQSIFGSHAAVTDVPLSQALARSLHPPAPRPRDIDRARRLLAGSGWKDSDGDGVLDRAGHPLALDLIVPSTSAPRRTMAQQVQEQWRQLGIALSVQAVDPNPYLARRRAGQFDLEFWAVSQDPTPSGLVQSWSCAGIGGSNVAHYCDPRVDTLLARVSSGRGDPRALWDRVLRIIAADVPAVFIYATESVALIQRRFEDVTLRPDSPWADVWRWRFRQEAALPRDAE
jgi:peptide/nickel transport system substrate-binding protein